MLVMARGIRRHGDSLFRGALPNSRLTYKFSRSPLHCNERLAFELTIGAEGIVWIYVRL